MKNQQVGVDYWAMGKAMLMYLVLTGMCWLMLRLFKAVFMLPRKLKSQQEHIQKTLQELQKRFPDMNITEDDLKNAEKELEEFTKEDNENEINEKETEGKDIEPAKEEVAQTEDKKTI